MQLWQGFASVASDNGLSLPQEWWQPLGNVFALLQKFNAKTNLVGKSEPSAVFQEHVCETLALVNAVASVGKTHRAVSAFTSAVDVGAGAGLETLVLALAWPTCAFTVIEPRRKRADFIELAADRAGVGRRVRVLRTQLRPQHQQNGFDFATSRATFPPAKWLQLAPGLVAENGLIALHRRLGDISADSSVRLVGNCAVPRSDREVAVFRAANSPAQDP